jgi:hypothetical protein
LRLRLPGYVRLETPGAAGFVLETCQSALLSILTDSRETLWDFAARQPGARRFAGRTTVYTLSLPNGCGDAVVRRSMRGGALARLNTDLFLPPTRGLRELVTSLRLRSRGVATPEIVAFAVYRAGTILRRSDVVTREIKNSTDLAGFLNNEADSEQRSRALEAVASLVASLSRAGAHHPDLNLKNILLAANGVAESGVPPAHVLDVDRIRFHIPGDPIVLSANIDRLERSIHKWRDRQLLRISDAEIAALRARTKELAS